MSAIRIAEQFKDQVKKYNTKIYVLVPGPNTRENFKKELLTSTGETYLKNKEGLNMMSKLEIEREKKNAIYSALQYYKILSYKTFYRKVLGEKIVEKKIVGESKIKSSYRKTAEGDYEREIVVDRITNMNNSILIIDEAHNISGNEYGEALKKIIKSSENLRIILLTATPIINLADEIVDLLNFIRPLDDQIQREKIFTSEKNYLMKIKPGGLEYLKDKARGYISYYRGSIPYTFAKRVEKGVIPSGMLFTPVIKCFMEKFQYDTYIETTTKFDDTLDKASSAASNFVFPGLNKDKTNLIGYYSTEGMNTVISQLNTDGAKLRSLINKKIFDGKLSKGDEENFIFENDKKNITGLILKMQYIKKFSNIFNNIL
jgi:DNA polymerase III delta prime subunit